MRNMVWSKEKAFQGWTCSDCGWLYPNPNAIGVDLPPTTDAEGGKLYESQAMKVFEAHDCHEHPKRGS
jgi:hypothetical protein